MSGSYDECAGADDTMDSFWEVQTTLPCLVWWVFNLQPKPLPSSVSCIDVASKAQQSPHRNYDNEISVTKFLQKKES